MENKTKRQLYERIETQMTGRPVRELDLELFCARSLAEKLDISRNLASQYLSLIHIWGARRK